MTINFCACTFCLSLSTMHSPIKVLTKVSLLQKKNPQHSKIALLSFFLFFFSRTNIACFQAK